MGWRGAARVARAERTALNGRERNQSLGLAIALGWCSSWAGAARLNRRAPCAYGNDRTGTFSLTECVDLINSSLLAATHIIYRSLTAHIESCFVPSGRKLCESTTLASS